MVTKLSRHDRVGVSVNFVFIGEDKGAAGRKLPGVAEVDVEEICIEIMIPKIGIIRCK